MTIQNAWSNVSGSVPPYALADGQIAINQADDILFSRHADGTIRRALLPKRYGVADAAFTVRSFDTYIGVASLTASRTITLPAASAYPAGQQLTISDESGACSPSVALTVAAAGSDKIDGASTMALTAAYGALILVSDGTSKWTVIAQPAAGAANAVLYVTQSITPGQKLLARQNIGVRGAGVIAVSAAYTVTSADAGRLIVGTGSWTLPLTAAATLGNGFVVEVQNGGTGVIVVDPNGSETVNGAATLSIPAGQSATLLCDGVNWQATGLGAVIIASNYSGASGFCKWSDGRIDQWGRTPNISNTIISFPLAFPNQCASFVATVEYNDNNSLFSVFIDQPTTTGCAAHTRYANGTSTPLGNFTVDWMAKGN